jgi:nucleotide-binding universal stress UspA family protein
VKSILVPIDLGGAMPSVMTVAGQLAGRTGGRLDGTPLRPPFADVIAPDPIVAVTLPHADWDEAGYQRKTRALFDTALAATGASGPRAHWRPGRAVDDEGLGALCRIYDISVIARPGRGASRMSTLESALFEGGRPVLMAPPKPLATFGDTVLIHWNCSEETARAIALALPLLTKAKRVHLLTVTGSTTAGPAARDSLAYFEAHGIAATEATVDPKSLGPGEAILAEAKAMGADLLIKGAYTQSRLRQMIFGGATASVLAKAELPVLLAH